MPLPASVQHHSQDLFQNALLQSPDVMVMNHAGRKESTPGQSCQPDYIPAVVRS
jgi:hypothetical protein